MSSGKVKSRHLITTIINYYYRHVRHLICINYNNGLCTRLIKFVLLITIKVSSPIDKSRVHHHQPWPCYRRRGWHSDCDKGDIRTNDCLVASCLDGVVKCDFIARIRPWWDQATEVTAMIAWVVIVACSHVTRDRETRWCPGRTGDE